MSLLNPVKLRVTPTAVIICCAGCAGCAHAMPWWVGL